MKMINKLIEEICKDKKIDINSFSKEWVIHLKKDQVNKYIIGYDFDLNSSSVNLILKDKAAMTEILNFNKIPCAEHKLFMTPNRADFVGQNGNWEEMMKYAKEYDYKLVCKYNYGSGGINVLRTSNKLELEQAVHNILEKELYICLSPFYNIEEEYRAIVLDGIIKIVYKKERLFVIADGNKKLKQLLIDNDIKLTDSMLRAILENKLNLEKVYDMDEKILLNWKHNLGQGAIPIEIDDKSIIDNIQELIKRIVKVIDIRFASFDVIKVNGEYMILEINAGVMMEAFANKNDGNYRKAYEIYSEAIDKMFKKDA